MHVEDLPTPALVVDRTVLDANIATMAAARPGTSLRPHVKAFKSTGLAARLAAAGHRSFCGATPAELLGMAAAGLGDDLLLANESVDTARLRALAEADARVTVAVDSPATVDAAAAAGIGEVLVDVDVGCFRCGCAPTDAPALADRARSRGLEVRGVMGYEGQLMMEPDATRAERVEAAMAPLVEAHRRVGGEVISGGGTGTWAENRWVTELQAGSYTLMDTEYGGRGLPFGQALHVHATVVSVHAGGWAVADAGLKAMSTEHGDPTVLGYDVVYLSDEHTTFVAGEDGPPLPAVGDRVRIAPSHVDPTVARHPVLHVVDSDRVVDRWDVDLRDW